MPLLPSTRSPWWLLVFLGTAAVWTGMILLAGQLGPNAPPIAERVVPVVQVLAAITGTLALLGALGLRSAFLGAHLGLLVGWAQLVVTLGGDAAGTMADLGAVVLFLMLGAAGLVVGLIVDVVRIVRHR